MCFDMEGKHIDNEYEIEVEKSVTEDDTKGPIIICVDTVAQCKEYRKLLAKLLPS